MRKKCKQEKNKLNTHRTLHKSLQALSLTSFATLRCYFLTLMIQNTQFHMINHNRNYTEVKNALILATMWTQRMGSYNNLLSSFVSADSAHGLSHNLRVRLQSAQRSR